MLNRSLKVHVLPAATRLFNLGPLRGLPILLEKAGAALQSKRGGGYASMWQEVQGAVNFINDPSPTIFDVGANAGHWTSSILMKFPELKHVYMFEPQPSCWPALTKLIGDKVSLEKKAASDSVGTLTFWTNANSEISSVYEQAGGGDAAEAINVEATTLDEFVADRRIGFVDYVKIDVEGHELFVLKGAQRSIEKGIINAFSFEFGQADVASRTFFRDFWSYITDLGMQVYRLGHDGLAIRVPEYSCDLENFSGVANYVGSKHQPKRWR